MGASYYAIGGIGYLVDLNGIDFDDVIVHSCEHPERIGNVFCPKCGTKVTETVQDKTDMFYEISEAFEEAAKAEDGFVWEQTDYEDAIYFLGYGASVSDYRGDTTSLEPMSNDEIKTVIARIVLAAQKLYEDGFEEAGDVPKLSTAINAEAFGVHICMVSC